jgi:HK97 family phage prohead protease
MEERAIKIEVRAAADDPDAIEGHAALFDSLSQDLGGFREVIKPGAFTRALAESDDILCVVSHDPERLLGRTGSGTCTVMQDDRGLKFRCKMPNTSLGRDMREMISRGDMQECSFKFALDDNDEDADEWDENEGFVRRTIRSVARLYDVSVCREGAYRSTRVKVK